MDDGERLHQTPGERPAAQAEARAVPEQPGPPQNVQEVRVADRVDKRVQTGGRLTDHTCPAQGAMGSGVDALQITPAQDREQWVQTGGRLTDHTCPGQGAIVSGVDALFNFIPFS